MLKQLKTLFSHQEINSREAQEYRTRLTYLQDRLEKVRIMYDMESDPEKIESLIYEEKALMIRLNHLIKSEKDKREQQKRY